MVLSPTGARDQQEEPWQLFWKGRSVLWQMILPLPLYPSPHIPHLQAQFFNRILFL